MASAATGTAIAAPPLTVTVERGRLRMFAKAIGERNPIYSDVDAARAAGHPDLLVPPTFLFGLELEQPDPFAWLADFGAELAQVLHAGQQFRYHTLVHAGDDLTVQSRIVESYERQGGALLFIERTTEVTRGTQPVATMQQTVAVRQPGAPAPRRPPREGRVDHRQRPVTGLVPGGGLPPLSPGRISRTVLALFAGGSGDHNPVHIDVDAAAAAGMADVFAHGMLSMAYLGRLLTAAVRQHRLVEFGVRFVAVTPVNVEPTCSGAVVGIEEHDGRGAARVELDVRLPDGTVTVTGHALLYVEDE